MSDVTPNLELILPEQADYYNSGVHYGNYSKIDTAYSDMSDSISQLAVNVKTLGAGYVLNTDWVEMRNPIE